MPRTMTSIATYENLRGEQGVISPTPLMGRFTAGGGDPQPSSGDKDGDHVSQLAGRAELERKSADGVATV